MKIIISCYEELITSFKEIQTTMANNHEEMLKEVREKMERDKEDSSETAEIQKFKSMHIPAHHHTP